MAGEPQIVSYMHHQQLVMDYVDTLEPGYRFRPTDSELIVYYLSRKIEVGEHPKGRLYDANVYDYHPQQLTGCYPCCDGIWYFFTKREAKYSKGKRVNRRTKDFGHWRSQQTGVPVYDFVTGRAVGEKRSLTFHDDENQKTSWLMHEYTYNHPNLPDDNKLTDWALCKIYKKESNRSLNNNNQSNQQVRSSSTNGSHFSNGASSSSEEIVQQDVQNMTYHEDIVNMQISRCNPSMDAHHVTDDDDDFWPAQDLEELMSHLNELS